MEQPRSRQDTQLYVYPSIVLFLLIGIMPFDLLMVALFGGGGVTLLSSPGICDRRGLSLSSPSKWGVDWLYNFSGVLMLSAPAVRVAVRERARESRGVVNTERGVVNINNFY